ncbi:uncharacterized protein LOC131236792 isoform X2 [Magnolia sinica]|uniref:uncharacterized protein LOC131236792 isoform X2 n=1 Tax=Magnolia sinica TaxID=86752 RepID=UPI002657CD88|nr:uncharacterized protein LOC131236792 isoform X2 [Magnolia sinica]
MQAARSAVFSSKSYAARFPASESVSIEISNAVHGSNIQWRGRSFAASVPSDSSKPQRGQKRLSKDERRAMLESFVDKYRAMNAGKFPSVSLARKHVGGGYYAIREILQKMVYEYNKSPVSKKIETVVGKTEKAILPHLDAKEESQVSTEINKVSGSMTTAGSTSCDLISGMKENTSIEIVKSTKMAKEEPQITIQVKKALNEVALNLVATVSSPLDESLGRGAETVGIKGRKPNTRLAMGIDREVCDQKFDNERAEDNIGDVAGDLASTPIASTKKQPTACSEASSIQDSSTHTISAGSGIEVVQPLEEVESSRKDETASKVLDGLKGESVLKGGQEGHESEKSQRETSKRVHSEEPPPERSTVWGGLKSLADGFINFWRKL